jgi:predicted RNase H-like HicB family nuclease
MWPALPCRVSQGENEKEALENIKKPSLLGFGLEDQKATFAFSGRMEE